MSDFPIYMPWLPARTDFALQHAKTDLFMLDVQLGSACNAKCPRCDSSCSDLHEPAQLDLDALTALAAEINERHVAELNRTHSSPLPGGRNIGFVCGLGEPTAGQNLTKLKELLARTTVHDFAWSMFVNGIHWDEELDHYLKSGWLSVMVQYNSDQPELVAEMLGVTSKHAGAHLQNRAHLMAMANWLNSWHLERTGTNLTGVAASIVPERDNLNELMTIVQQCVDSGVFPLIAELENAGHSKDEYYEQHKLHDHELRTLYQQLEYRFGIQYEVPTCPATFGAIHVNNRNIVTVDEFTGLSCGWFGMGDPKVHKIGDIRAMSYDEIVRAILEYREARIPDVRRAINDYPDMVFGGCGGNARKLLADYVALYD